MDGTKPRGAAHAQGVGVLVGQVQSELTRVMATAFARSGVALTYNQIRVLRRLRTLGPMSVGALARSLPYDSGGMTRLRHMRIGQPVTLTADLYGSDVVYHGHVVGLGVGTGSAFSLLPAQNATGNWIKIVQRLPVRIALDPDALKAHPLRMGLSMQVKVDLHDRSGALLSDTRTGAGALQTDVYDDDEAALNVLIADIVRRNGGVATAAAGDQP